MNFFDLLQSNSIHASDEVALQPESCVGESYQFLQTPFFRIVDDVAERLAQFGV